MAGYFLGSSVDVHVRRRRPDLPPPRERDRPVRRGHRPIALCPLLDAHRHGAARRGKDEQIAGQPGDGPGPAENLVGRRPAALPGRPPLPRGMEPRSGRAGTGRAAGLPARSRGAGAGGKRPALRPLLGPGGLGAAMDETSIRRLPCRRSSGSPARRSMPPAPGRMSGSPRSCWPPWPASWDCGSAPPAGTIYTPAGAATSNGFPRKSVQKTRFVKQTGFFITGPFYFFDRLNSRSSHFRGPRRCRRRLSSP